MYLQLLFLVACFMKDHNAMGTIYYDDPNSGTVTSRGFPRKYPNNHEQKYLITAPKTHSVVLNFTHFELQGWYGNDDRRTDWLKVVDGKVKGNTNHKKVLHGYLATPFVLVSKTNTFRLKFVTDGRRTYQGFKAKYYFMDKTKYCNKTALESRRHTSVISCSDEVKEFAKRCRILSKGSRKAVACKNGVFVEAPKVALIDESVRRCEDTDMEICPYSLEEILEYYETHELSYSSLTEEEIAAVAEFDEFVLPSVGRSIHCPQQFCSVSRTGKYLKPKSCGHLKQSRLRIKCMRCRFFLNCGKRRRGYLGKRR